ncbi:K02A2.6-like [Cordylochernes scorpioides]|uniref:K02A2.6-like n=1 Tax=Cordylochernes scorpioides TaxID=51811 RepID=A0ABY6KCF4_9ARAC|nr:K02A2.6-like [Cordylochernes scorpioides]
MREVAVNNASFLAVDVDGDVAGPQDSDPRREDAGEARTPYDLIEVASRDIPNDPIVVAECRKELLLERELTAPSSVVSLTSNRDGALLLCVKIEKLDIIQPSGSPWASPVVLIRKKDGSWRFCVNYRRLNKIAKKDVYPLPRIDDTLDCLREAKFYSSMELQTGYWQIDVEESDREKTAFITPDGLYEFNVMPFGLCNAPATFERMIYNLLKGLKWTICLCYLDDIIVFSDDFEEHLRRLQLVLNCLRKAGLCLNSKKCKFGAKTITVLGHEVSENGIRPDQEKIRAGRDFATPRSLKEVRNFLGLSSYYRRFIPNYAHLAQPLNDLLKKRLQILLGPRRTTCI